MIPLPTPKTLSEKLEAILTLELLLAQVSKAQMENKVSTPSEELNKLMLQMEVEAQLRKE